VLPCGGTGLAMGGSPVQGAVPKCPNVFIVSEVNSESEQRRGPKPWHVQQLAHCLCLGSNKS